MWLSHIANVSEKSWANVKFRSVFYIPFKPFVLMQVFSMLLAMVHIPCEIYSSSPCIKWQVCFFNLFFWYTWMVFILLVTVMIYTPFPTCKITFAFSNNAFYMIMTNVCVSPFIYLCVFPVKIFVQEAACLWMWDSSMLQIPYHLMLAAVHGGSWDWVLYW